MRTGIKASRDRGIVAAGGFSLVEILISILILGLGLLGLGALFPVVIRQQRISTDQTLGVIAGESARSKLGSGVYASSAAWRLFGTMAPPGAPPLPPGIALADQFNWNTGATTGTQPYEHGEWYVDPSPYPKMVLENDIDVQRGIKRGAAWIGYPSDNLTWSPIPLSERFYPADSDTPQFAWDFAVQRVSDGLHDSSPGLDPIRAALFVRRIDQRIRVPKGQTLRQVLLAEGGVSASDQRSPFGEDAQEQPTQDGTDGAGGYRYSQVKAAAVQFIHQPGVGPLEGRDRLYVPAAPTVPNTVFSLMRQPNQKLVDNLGNIYTVITDGEDTLGRYLKIEPPVPASVTDRQSQNNTPFDADRIAIREAAFTAQIPVYVTTLEVAK